MNAFWVNLGKTFFVLVGIPWFLRWLQKRRNTSIAMFEGGVGRLGNDDGSNLKRTEPNTELCPSKTSITITTEPSLSKAKNENIQKDQLKESKPKRKKLSYSGCKKSCILDQVEQKQFEATKSGDNSILLENEIDTGTGGKIPEKSKRHSQRKKNEDSQSQQQQEEKEEAIVFHQTSSQHPGLQGFYLWQDVLSSIYRIYRIGKSTQSVEEMMIPIQPRSERGFVSIELQVKNEMDNIVIDVFWLGYKGEEVPRGSIQPFQVWYQTTWIGHPWIFRCRSTNQVLVHFIPYRVIPNTRRVPTTNSNGLGIHCFAIQKPTFISMSQNELCHIHDPIFPQPGDISRIEKAITWCCRQYEREQVTYNDNAGCIRTLIKYLQNILHHHLEDDTTYRRIRIANPIFQNQVWITAGRGVLHALGFVEHGAYIEMGPLPNRHKLISDAVFSLQQLLIPKNNEQNRHVRQPSGVDGTGRAHFGTAGAIN